MPNSLRPPEPELASPSQVASAGTPSVRGRVGIEVAAIVVAALYFAREVLIPVTLAMLPSFVLSPLVELLRQIWLGRILSVVLAVVLALGLILALGSAIGTQVAQLSGNLPQYQTTIETKISGLRNATIDKFSAKLGSFGHQLTGSAPRSEAPAPAPTGAPAQGQEQNPVPVVVTQPAPPVLDIGKSVLEPLLYPVTTAGIILVVTIFALLQKEDLRDRAIRLLGSSDLHRATVAMDEAGRRLSRYFLTQLSLSAGFGVIVGVGLYFHRRPQSAAVGHSRRAVALRSLCRIVDRRRAAGGAGGDRRAGLVDGSLDGGALRRHRTDHGAGGRASRLWPQHGSVADCRDYCRDLLDLDLGPDRADHIDPADAVPRRARPAHRGARVLRRIARRSPGADPDGAPLPAHACRGSRRSGRAGRALSRGPAALILL